VEGARQSWRDPAGASPAQVSPSEPPGSECCVRRRQRRTRSVHSGCVECAIEPRKVRHCRAEGFHSPEGNMCGTATRGADALPRSKATSRAKGSYRNLGGLGSGHRCRMSAEYDGPHREGEEPSGAEKSDLAIVAVKPANKARKAHCGGASRQAFRVSMTSANRDLPDRFEIFHWQK
jgi:hypothetical protein